MTRLVAEYVDGFYVETKGEDHNGPRAAYPTTRGLLMYAGFEPAIFGFTDRWAAIAQIR